MRIGLPKEIRIHEYRVGMTSAGIEDVCRHGHQVLVETAAGAGITLADADKDRGEGCIAS